ncbi:GNAT family N-acetyltransferase [Vibrio maerlii]|uniref:GNAT family N-acetyltransferase n=1 Tax=Vibrio maerlii TaxID=2231648 RepID=UPI000E3BA151|nr:GNAT family N-acetyltransferase [Vibrio maerlii]
MEFRLAEYKDYQRIAELHAQSWKRYYNNILSQDYLEHEVDDDRSVLWQTRLINPSFNEFVLLAEENDKLCGFVCAYGNHDVERGTLIDNLHVLPECQGRGVGQQLLTGLCDWVDNYFTGSGLYLEVLQGNEQAMKFYEQIGGVQSSEGIWKSPDGTGIKEVVYQWKTADDMKLNKITLAN